MMTDHDRYKVYTATMKKEEGPLQPGIFCVPDAISAPNVLILPGLQRVPPIHDESRLSGNPRSIITVILRYDN